MSDFANRRRIMVDTQVRPSDVTKFPIIDAMLSVPREKYVPNGMREAAYVGENVEVAPGRVILEPRTLAKMLDALDIRPTDAVLDIAPALGYSSALLARLAEIVIAVEEDEALAAEAEATLADEDIDNVVLIRGPHVEGAAKHGPYDIILIGGSVEVVPETILAQLKPGGRIACVFAEGALGVCRIGYKYDDAVSWRFAFNAGAPLLPEFARRDEFVL